MSPRVYVLLFLVLSLSFRVTRLVQVIRNAHARGRGQTSAPMMFRIMTASYFVFLVCCAKEGFSRLSHFSWLFSLLGLFLYVGALAVREWAMRDLGRYFSPDIEIRTEHRLIREGLYRYVRHPLLACMGYEILGVGLVFNAYTTLLFLGIGFYFPLIMVRKSLEEKALINALGDAYRRYKKEVGAFWPKPHRRFQVLDGGSHV